MRPARWTPHHLVMLASLATCADGNTWAGTMTDSSGVTIVTNTDRGLWAGGEGWTLEEDLRLRIVEG